MTDFPETNPSLIARVKDLGDGASWAEFLGIYQPVVYRMAKRRGLQDAEARKEIVRWATQQIRTEFTPETWDVFWRTSIEGLPIAEVARSTGRSAGAIYVARHRVIARLKEKVAEVSQHWELVRIDHE